MPGLDAEADNVVSDLDYRIFAKNIQLTSAVAAPLLDSTELYIGSMGAGEPLNNGSVLVEANGNIALKCGKAYVSLRDDALKSEVIMGNDLEGSIELWQGNSPGSANLRLVGPLSPAAALAVGVVGAGSVLGMTPLDLELANGPPGVGAGLKMSPTGLKLTFAAWSIEMSPAGIDLEVGTNKISIQPTGIAINGMTLDLQALTKLSLQGLQIQESATAQWTGSSSTIKQL